MTGLMGVFVAAVLCAAAGGAEKPWRVFEAQPAPDLVPVVRVGPVRQTIRIDGDLGDWAGVEPLGDFTPDRLRTAGRTGLEPGQTSALRVRIRAGWDHRYLYVCAQVTDPSPAYAPPAKDAGDVPDWRTRLKQVQFRYDSVSVNLQPYPDVLAGSRALPNVPEPRKGWYDPRFVMFPYVRGNTPFAYPDGRVYACRPTRGGYVVEGRIAFDALGFVPEPGDQMAFCVHVVDASPDSTVPVVHHLWNVVPMPPGGSWWKGQREGDPIGSWGRMRLVDRAGWSASLSVGWVVGPLDVLRYVGTADVGTAGLHVAAIEVREVGTRRLVRRLPVGQRLRGPGAYRLRGAIPLRGLMPGRYTLTIGHE